MEGLVTIVAGSRTSFCYVDVMEILDRCPWQIIEICHGGCRGVDTFSDRWAKDNRVPAAVFPADWQGFGRAAGPIRNEEMVKYADALVAIWDGKSRGTRDIIQKAKKAGLRMQINIIPEVLSE